MRPEVETSILTACIKPRKLGPPLRQLRVSGCHSTNRMIWHSARSGMLASFRSCVASTNIPTMHFVIASMYCFFGNGEITMLWRPRPILGRHHRVLLQAALGEGEAAANAYQNWRASVRLDDIDAAAYRVLPLLLTTAEKHGLQDLDERRLRGIAKHIWLSNMLRMQALSTALAALSVAGIRTLLLKGAALFARCEEFAAVRLTEDYDLLVHRSDAPRAINALTAAGFKSQFSLQADRFDVADFETIHAAHFVIKSKRNSSLDLHWRPLPGLLDPGYVDDMFLHTEATTIAGCNVELASLANHLFLVVARPEPWEKNEMFARTVEAVQLLRVGGGRIGWTRFEHLVVKFGVECIAASMLRLVRDDLQAPVPDGLVERL